jgi:hypothetical protein
MNASAMPVLPEVGSISSPPGARRPLFSAASIMARPMRSLTDDSGLKNSSLASTVASLLIMRRMRTSGVLPMVWVMSSKIRAMVASSGRPGCGARMSILGTAAGAGQIRFNVALMFFFPTSAVAAPWR